MPTKQNIATLEDLEIALAKEPHRITLAITTASAMNGYGCIKTYECQIELIRRRCEICKRQENGRKLDDYCPANGYHKVKDSWVMVYQEYDSSLAGVIGKILKQIGPQGPLSSSK